MKYSFRMDVTYMPSSNLQQECAQKPQGMMKVFKHCQSEASERGYNQCEACNWDMDLCNLWDNDWESSHGLNNRTMKALCKY